jgi:hypothetical protein
MDFRILRLGFSGCLPGDGREKKRQFISKATLRGGPANKIAVGDLSVLARNQASAAPSTPLCYFRAIWIHLCDEMADNAAKYDCSLVSWQINVRRGRSMACWESSYSPSHDSAMQPCNAGAFNQASRMPALSQMSGRLIVSFQKSTVCLPIWPC